MSASPTVFTEVHYTHTLSSSVSPSMGQPQSLSSVSRSRLDHESGGRCALHQIGSRDVDTTTLNKNDIWLGRNLSTSSARKALIPFHKIPFRDWLQPSADNEERLVYCGDCLKYQSKDPLTFTLQYEQNDQMKVSEIHLTGSWGLANMCIDSCP